MSNNNMIFSLDLGKSSISGKSHSQNEDLIGYYFPQEIEALLLRGQMLVIADGSGAEGAGITAAKLAVQTVIAEYFDSPWVGSVPEMLIKAISSANLAVYDTNIESRPANRLSCSLTAAVVHQESLHLAHVGSCCAYFLSGSRLEKLTQCHAIEVSESSRLPDDELALVRALGLSEQVQVDLVERKLQIGDAVLLCTDGAYSTFSEPELQALVSLPTSQSICDAIVKQAADRQNKDDATALMVKMKSIKRIDAAEELPPPKIETPGEPPARQITIKGVRYRSPVRISEMPPEEKQSVNDFAQDRELRRPMVKRKEGGRSAPNVPLKSILKTVGTILAGLLLIFLIFQYGPQLWFSLTAPSIEEPSQKQQVPPTKTDQEPAYTEEGDQALPPSEDESGYEPTPALEETPAITPAGTSLQIAVLDGTFQPKLDLASYLNDMKSLSSTDKINKIKSTIRLKKSKIIWRRGLDANKDQAIQERVAAYQRLFARYFQISPETHPLDLTLVLGANFKLPGVKGGSPATAPVENCYLEILNGSPLTGLAARMNQILDGQPLENEKIVVVDYRNADKKNYPSTFIQCPASQNKKALALKKRLGTPVQISNAASFDIKILIGTDITL
ncbi:MAG: protein phosphatase 2C domain-containing protein [candidate division KSB1 bacterium]|nr:protein phosphatase 2C domain-containing protein [candidate division KSB1 bacterium]MDZ7317722.1 protein phosphatase 2C domain-containing protein [candidate division KSB1 bacterium]MDZ7340235.1 protein phosphatase 2C domain-containing protein [candidate division KSB1 bacterium]